MRDTIVYSGVLSLWNRIQKMKFLVGNIKAKISDYFSYTVFASCVETVEGIYNDTSLVIHGRRLHMVVVRSEDEMELFVKEFIKKHTEENIHAVCKTSDDAFQMALKTGIASSTLQGFFLKRENGRLLHAGRILVEYSDEISKENWERLCNSIPVERIVVYRKILGRQKTA